MSLDLRRIQVPTKGEPLVELERLVGRIGLLLAIARNVQDTAIVLQLDLHVVGLHPRNIHSKTELFVVLGDLVAGRGMTHRIVRVAC
jgi:hypothetical protein